MVLRATPFSRPGQQGDGQPGLLGHGGEALVMLAGENFGRRHHGGLTAGLDGARHGEQAHHRLARAHVALEQAQHLLVGDEVAPDVLDGLHLGGGEPEGQGALQALDQMPVARVHPTRQPPHPASHEGEGKLGGEQFVIGEAPARSRFGDGVLGELRRIVRSVEAEERLPEIGQGVAVEPGRVLPFGQVGDLVERRADIAADHAR